MIHKHFQLLLLGLIFFVTVQAGLNAQNSNSATTYLTQTELLYLDSTLTPLTDYARERCRLDIYYPENKTDFATVVWFHGGGITGGNKFIPEGLKEQGIAVVAVNYRLSPQVKAPVYIEDAAAAIAWTMKHIGEYGGDPEAVFVSGHSAGGYLASMVAMDTTYLEKHDLNANDLAGIISYSGHAVTHFTIRQERGLGWEDVVVDEYAPLSHIRKNLPPLVLILGDRNLEIYGRYEEVAYLWRMMQLIKHPFTRIYELDGYSHGAMAVPAHHILLNNLREILEMKK
ncbi:alpha/beta hydrolase [Flavilitoribacter nigricans]|uniref:Lipase n=1 Tax=Flavilitoribacter nigricans (strain ATCC 23147 / DSM 23189 / NBRC 102662 / NCIMB 1420 / SS-2) TaxID=1122177 RepID=A0A2D0NBN1_FLAN2|nr:alpha/beta hydrolase [Flavilitoribacter nigricans]PHN05895.1 lipase [Flavilitoribacter nigricans DSM 23189 = NBRC 102662]